MATKPPAHNATSDVRPEPILHLGAVLALAARGWRVFPCRPRDKTPAVREWQRVATTNPAIIQTWFAEHPACNWGLACGPGSGIWVVDVDGPKGEESLKTLIERCGQLPARLTVRTGKGLHLYFAWPNGTELRNSAGRIGEGLDVRGEGGYVMAPGSVHPSGTIYNIAKDAPVPAAPGWLVQLAASPVPHIPAAHGFATGGNGLIPAGWGEPTKFKLAAGMFRSGANHDEVLAAVLLLDARCENQWGEPKCRLKVDDWGKRCGQPGTIAGSAEAELVSKWPEPLKPEAFHGLAGEIVRGIEPYSEADPAALLAQLLVGFGNLLGRRPYYRIEEDIHFSNEFLVLAGKTSKARKGTSWTRIRKLLEQADPTWATRVLPGLSSGEGLVHQVRDPSGEDAGEPDKRLLVLEPEFASVLATMARQGNTLSPIIRQAWDGGRLGNLTKKSSECCAEPHISIIAHITVEELSRSLDRTELANGFANRFLFICVRRSKHLPDGAQVPEQVQQQFADRLKAAVGFARTVDQMSRSDKARELWHQVYGQLSQGRAGLLGAVIGRAEAHVLRLSCLYALLDARTVVGSDHMMAALTLWKYAEDSAEFIFGDATGDPVADTIVKALRANPDGMNRTQVSELFARNRSKARIDSALASLAEQGIAHVTRQEAEAGRPLEIWFEGPAK